MRILILGGSRFIGATLTRRLLDRGHDVTLANRGSTAPPVSLDGAHHIAADLDQLDDDALDALRATRPEVVIHMLIDGTQRTWDLLRLLEPLPQTRALFISSVDVYRAYGLVNASESGPPVPVPFDEDSPLRQRLHPYREACPDPAPTDAEGWSTLRKRDSYDKIPAEMMFRLALGARGTILRLPAVYGPGDFQHRLYGYARRMADQRPHLLLDAGFAGWRWSRGHVANMAHAIVLAAEQPEAAAGQTFHVAEPDSSLPGADWVRLIGARMGWSGELHSLPRERLPEPLRSDNDFRHDIVIDTHRIRARLGYQEIVPLEAGLDDTIAWELAHPPDPEKWPDPFDYAAEDAALTAAEAGPLPEATPSAPSVS